MNTPDFPLSQNSFFYSKLIEQRDKCAGCSVDEVKFFKLSDHFEKHLEDNHPKEKELRQSDPKEVDEDNDLIPIVEDEFLKELATEKNPIENDFLKELNKFKETDALSHKSLLELTKCNEPEESTDGSLKESGKEQDDMSNKEPKEADTNMGTEDERKEVITILEALSAIFQGRFLIDLSEIQGFNNHINFCYKCVDQIATMYKLVKEFTQLSLTKKSLLSDMVCFEEPCYDSEEDMSRVPTFGADLDLIYAGVEFSEGVEAYSDSEMESLYPPAPIIPTIQLQFVNTQFGSIYQNITNQFQTPLIPVSSPIMTNLGRQEAIYACSRCQRPFTRVGLLQHMARKTPCEAKGPPLNSNGDVLLELQKKKRKIPKYQQIMKEKGIKPCCVRIVPLVDRPAIKKQFIQYKKKLIFEMAKPKTPVVLSCYTCQTTFDDLVKLKRHMIQTKKRKFRCKHCFKNFCVLTKHRAHEHKCGGEEPAGIVNPLRETTMTQVVGPEAIRDTPQILSSMSLQQKFPNLEKLSHDQIQQEEQKLRQSMDKASRNSINKCAFCFEVFAKLQDYKIHMRNMKFRCRKCFKNFCGFQLYTKHQDECNSKRRDSNMTLKARSAEGINNFNSFKPQTVSQMIFSKTNTMNLLRKVSMSNGVSQSPTKVHLKNFIGAKKLSPSKPIEFIDLGDEDSNKKGDNGEVTVPVFHNFPVGIPALLQELQKTTDTDQVAKENGENGETNHME